MKHIFIVCSLAISILCSCNKDFLDRQPLDEYSESSLWTSVKDAEAALNGCYRNWEDGQWIFYIDCASDNAFNPYPWEGYSMMGNAVQLTPTNTGYSRWDFRTIQKCNWFLENVDKTPMDEELKKRMKAEARFLRAYKYYLMSQLYGDVPLVNNALTPEEANVVTRNKKEEVVQFLRDELAAIAPDLPESYSGADEGRVTSGAAWALKARLELFNGKYEDCVAACEKIIGKYSLYGSYTDLFRMQNEHNSEIILNVEYIANDVPMYGLGVLVTESQGGWWSVDPTQSLVDSYEMKNGKTIEEPSSGYNPDDPYKNRDPRLEATIIHPGSFYEGAYFDPLNPSSIDYYAVYSYTGYAPRKYTSHLADFSDMWNSGLNIPVIRYAEILLSYAEAKIELYQLDNSVYDAVNQVRQRVGMPVVDQSVYNSQSKMRELVRRERRVELALEGLRWFDIQRWKIGGEVMNGPVYGSRLGMVDPATGKLTLTTERIVSEQRVFDESKNYLWPIPQREIDINKGLLPNNGY
ncbi:RagB/SusD family nutrient uptake outer membrane protein [Agriterribacter sp.]|uniref:RagB/SusD family nutrient uptake outer membrane protein n=1 Tax=Agriterribacter sp. TaxID=2821509 RepID=UPI002CBF2493|nr:RagB/SusD family nutrient uptake outer membrane protein [Agriterribacter sp.]HTN07355.1 RagB/SusD family nutrient uptake outer membrane protein [Agriterribacter sp.]